ncbi:MAG: YqeG family HAD IIIA-type phosphatase [Pirellulales bacterium]|nr:YqeG family HAD IIIA-type phosphatase [Pirellulales bacterium]
MLQLLQPHYCVKSVLELTPERLREWGIEALLLDVDCTLKRYPQKDVDPEIDGWLADLRESGIRCCIVSNGREKRIKPFAAQLGLPFVAKALKPFTGGVKDAMRKISASPSQTAIIGDQLFADIIAGRLAGIRTILVEPIHPEEEPWYTRIKRVPEGWVLKWLGK